MSTLPENIKKLFRDYDDRQRAAGCVVRTTDKNGDVNVFTFRDTVSRDEFSARARKLGRKVEVVS